MSDLAASWPRQPLRRLLWGTLLVHYPDFRDDGFLAVPDTIGWVVAALALRSLRAAVDDGPLGRRVRVAEVLAWVAAVVGVAETPRPLPPTWQLGYLVLTGVQGLAVAFALVRLGEVAGSPRLRRAWLRMLALLTVTSAALMVVAVRAYLQIQRMFQQVPPFPRAEPGFDWPLLVAMGLVALVVEIGYLVLLYLTGTWFKAAIPGRPLPSLAEGGPP